MTAFEHLLERNSSNLETYKKIISARGVDLPANINVKMSEAYQNILKGILEEYITGFPRVNSHLRLGLRYLWGDSFNDFLARYMRPLIIKGVPSVMMDLREFYVCPEKVTQIENFLARGVQSME